MLIPLVADRYLVLFAAGPVPRMLWNVVASSATLVNKGCKFGHVTLPTTVRGELIVHVLASNSILSVLAIFTLNEFSPP